MTVARGYRNMYDMSLNFICVLRDFLPLTTFCLSFRTVFFFLQTHIIREASVRYTEIRIPFQQAILCRHAIRFQCSRGTDCHFAHSLVERDLWAIMEKEK